MTCVVVAKAKLFNDIHDPPVMIFMSGCGSLQSHGEMVCENSVIKMARLLAECLV